MLTSFSPSSLPPVGALPSRRLWLALKLWLRPPVELEPGCSRQYAARYRQLRRATRLFWLASALLIGGTLVLAATGALR